MSIWHHFLPSSPSPGTIFYPSAFTPHVPQFFKMQSLRRAVTRASLTSAISSAAVSAAPRTQTISFAVRSVNALRCFSVAAPRAFARSNALLEEQQQAEDHATPSTNEGRAASNPNLHGVFVQNHPFHLTRDDITEAFSKFGEVAQLDMPANKSFFFVFFKDAESAQTAVENVDGTFWHGRRIVCNLSQSTPRGPREAREPREFTPRGNAYNNDRSDRRSQQDRPLRPRITEPTDTIFIGNISFDATDVDINQLASVMKDVKELRVATDKNTGWPRGFAHAQFHSVEAATAGLEAIQGQELRGRQIKANYAAQKRDYTPRSPREARE